MIQNPATISLLLPLVWFCGIVPCLGDGLRPLSTDRPDTTESPNTVDAGHYQFEMELASWTHDGGLISPFLGLSTKF